MYFKSFTTIILVFFLASPVFANESVKKLRDLNCLNGEIAIFDDTTGWGCGKPVGGTRIPQFIVFDSDPSGKKPVGTVLNLNEGKVFRANVMIEVETSLGSRNITAFVEVLSILSVSDQQTVWHELPDCGGSAFVGGERPVAGFLPAFAPFFLLNGTVDNSIEVHIAPNPTIVEASVSSVSNSSGCSNVSQRVMTLIPLSDFEIVSPDLQFFPPFTLEVLN